MTAVPARRRRADADLVSQWIEARREHVAWMIGELVRVPTVAPREPDGYAVMSEYLCTAEFEVRTEPPHLRLAAHPEFTAPFLPDRQSPRPNLRAIRRVDPALPTVLFSAHVDVVPPFGHPEPWSGRYDGAWVHGRGSVDTKNNIVLVIEAVRCMDDLGLEARANVALDLVSDEEAGGNGALSTILHGCAADEVVVLEPTSLRVLHGHRGCLSFKVVAEGEPRHMGSAEHRANPVEYCLEAIARLRQLAAEWLGQAKSWRDFAGPPAPVQLNVSGIHASGWHGASPRRCVLEVSLGFLPDRTPDEARSEIVAAVGAGSDGVRLCVAWEGIHNAAYLGSADGPTASRLRQAVRVRGGVQDEPRAWHVSCDARLYSRIGGLDTVVFGSGDICHAHSDHEAVELNQVLRGIAILVDYSFLHRVRIYRRIRRTPAADRRDVTVQAEQRRAERSEELSPYAWMSARDGELIKAILLNAAQHRRGQRLRVLEWGAGLSTLSFSAVLSEEDLLSHWLALEYDREFCDSSIAPELLSRPGAALRYVEDGRSLSGPPGDGAPRTEVMCWNRATLRPFLGDKYVADRAADLDAYVDYPLSAGANFDVILVDGRKRRRCLLTALKLMAEHTVVLLHDAFRIYYHSAMQAYPASRFIGDELWIGARGEAALTMALGGQEAGA
ncbi:MAG: M20 family metallopeptidase [Pseudonocardiaceae bacterium]